MTVEIFAYFRRTAVRLALTAMALLVPTVSSSAQVVAGGDFDICDNCGNASANTIRLVGRAGFGTNTGTFTLVNAAIAEQDIDNDGYTPGIDFTTLFISSILDFKNQSNPDIVIQARNFVLQAFLNPLRNGAQNNVAFSVTIPDLTPAGIYVGTVTIGDSLRAPAPNVNGELLRSDVIQIEIQVLPDRGLGLVEGDAAAELDSLVLRGQPGQTVSGVVRIANLGNVDLTNVTVEATDLVATSGTGLRIRSERITVSPVSLTTIVLGDTARAVVTVRIPTGILQGSYRGELIVQADGIGAVRVPLTVIVTTPGEIVFENNPVFGQNGDRGVIIFNADPGTEWNLVVFDVQGIITFKARGTVFAGSPATGGGLLTPGDEAVRYTWNLQNGRGENVAAGMYLVVIDVVQAGQRRQLRGKLMVIR